MANEVRLGKVAKHAGEWAEERPAIELQTNRALRQPALEQKKEHLEKETQVTTIGGDIQ